MKEREFIKGLARRFVSLMMSMTMLYTALPAYAEEAGETPTEAETVATTEAPPVYYDPDAETPTEAPPEGGESSSINIGGETMNVTSDSSWQEPGVLGEDVPTAEAPSLEQFCSMLGKGTAAKPNMYTLSAATGISAGDSVEYFAVRYTDEDGDPQTKYIFPDKNLEQTYQYLNSQPKVIKNGRVSVLYYASDEDKENGLTKKITYNIGDELTDPLIATYHAQIEEARQAGRIVREVYSDVTLPADGTSGNTDITNRHYVLSQQLGYRCNTPTETKRIDGLQPWSQDEYLFTTEKPIREVTGIEVFMGKGQWTIQGLAVSKVTGIGGIGEYGYLTGKYFIGLEKQRICYLLSRKSGTLTISAANERLVNIGGAGSSYFSLETDRSSTTSTSPFNDIYTFRIDIADTLDAGLESLLRQDADISSPFDWLVTEDIALEIEYRDRNGFTRNATMPVLLSMLAQLAESHVDVRTVGLAQRGDTLAFTGLLPEFSSLISTRIYVGSAARERLAVTGGFARSSAGDDDKGTTLAVDRTLMETTLDSDQIAFAGVSIYRGTCQMSNTPGGTDQLTGEALQSYTYTFAFSSAEPEMFYTTTNPNGYRINPGNSDTVRLIPHPTGAALVAAERDKNFLITLKTTDAQGADTKDDVLVRLTYTTLDGQSKVTGLYNARTEMQDDLGYWPNIRSATSDHAYEQGVSRGGYIQFPITLTDAAAITNVEVMLGFGGDEWRLESMCASIMYEESRRMVYRQDVNSRTSVSPYRMVRNRKTTPLPPFPLLVQKMFLEGESASVSMQSGSIIDTTSELDYNSIRYSMTYEQTKMNLGFIDRKKTYEINVKVADDPGANSINGDSGSRNYFYFALEFKNGTSGLVLANQQLTADAFRAGYEETFTITVNRDYSDLTAVRIIPEDLDTDSSAFDKLNIDRITVTEQTVGGAAMQYVIDPVGWIGIDYHDSGEGQSITGRDQRYLGELAHKYTINYQQKVVNFLCEIATQPWDSEYAYDYKQVNGSVMCDVEYIDKDNQPQTLSFDVIARMAAYMNKTPISFEGAASERTDRELYTNMKTVSDPGWMLRPNHTDRFILPALANVQSVKSMTFYATSRNNKPGKWVIGGVSLSQITKDNGKVDLTADGEYLRSLDTEPYCKARSDRGKVQLYLPAGMTQSVTIEFEDNLLAWTADDASSWITSVSRTPDSSIDELNLYLYPRADCLDIAGQKVSAALKYTQPYTSGDQKSIGELDIHNSGKSDAMFYALGVPATDMQTLSSLVIQCRNSSMFFDHAVVQQVRDDVIINTYYIKLDTSAIFKVETKPEAVVPEDAVAPRKQRMLLSFGAKTEEATLFAEKNDIAIALQYRSTVDHGARTYWSPYVYLTDVGIDKIGPGMMAEVPFDVPGVMDIVSYRIVPFGNLNARINAAFISNYSYAPSSDGTAVNEASMKREESYSFDEAVDLEIGKTAYPQRTGVGLEGPGTLVPLDLKIITAEAQENMDNVADTPILMYFNYQNSYKTLVRARYADIRPYIQGDIKQFMPGEEARIRILLPDCREMESIQVDPISEDGLASWTIERIDGTYRFDKPLTRRVGKQFMQLDINAIANDRSANQIMVKSATISSIVTSGETRLPVTNHKASIMMVGGTAGHVTVNVFGGSGYSAKVIWMVNGTETLYSKDFIYNVTETGFDFVAPENAENSPQTYAIRITHLDNDAVEDTVEITVPVPGAASETTAPTNDAGSDGMYYDDTPTAPSTAAPTEAPDVTEPTLEPPPAPEGT